MEVSQQGLALPADLGLPRSDFGISGYSWSLPCDSHSRSESRLHASKTEDVASFVRLSLSLKVASEVCFMSGHSAKEAFSTETTSLTCQQTAYDRDLQA